MALKPPSPLCHCTYPLVCTLSSASSPAHKTVTLPNAQVFHSFCSSDPVVIVDGGSVGSLADAALSTGGVPVTPLNDHPYILDFWVHRAYSFGLHEAHPWGKGYVRYVLPPCETLSAAFYSRGKPRGEEKELSLFMPFFGVKCTHTVCGSE